MSVRPVQLARRRPRSHLPADDPGRLAVIRTLAAAGSSDVEIARHLHITPNRVGQLRRPADIPSGRAQARRVEPAGRQFDLVDTDEL